MSRLVSSPRLSAELAEFRRDVVAGLSANPKMLPSKYFYDRRGSQLFDEICELEEYYLTRTEQSIVDEHAGAMAERIGRRAMLLELGSGSSTKTRTLLSAVHRPAVYVPIDISHEHLLEAAAGIAEEFPDIEVIPLHGDFGRQLKAPASDTRVDHRVVYFPGSTIGNLVPSEAEALLVRMARLAGEGGGVLIGIDLKKDPAVLEAAYNDTRGVTARFNKNLLRRINRELSGTFDLARFTHKAIFNREHARIEMHLVSRGAQTVSVGGKHFEFADGETVRTELSHKYRLEEFEKMARRAGLEVEQVWTDRREYVAVIYCRVAEQSTGITAEG